jgi:hypothetical protein
MNRGPDRAVRLSLCRTSQAGRAQGNGSDRQALCSKGMVYLAGAIGVLFLAAYGLSVVIGPVASRGCRSAMALAAVMLGLWILVVRRRRPWSGRCVDDLLAVGPWLRLRTAIVGMVLVGILLEEELMWFLGWAGFFYTALLIGQTAVVIWVLRFVDWNSNLWSCGDDEASVGRHFSC